MHRDLRRTGACGGHCAHGCGCLGCSPRFPFSSSPSMGGCSSPVLILGAGEGLRAPGVSRQQCRCTRGCAVCAGVYRGSAPCTCCVCGVPEPGSGSWLRCVAVRGVSPMCRGSPCVLRCTACACCKIAVCLRRGRCPKLLPALRSLLLPALSGCRATLWLAAKEQGRSLWHQPSFQGF